MRPRDDNKMANLKEKAIEIIVQEGFKGLSMQKLAKAAAISPATIYIYYKDREDLLTKLYLEIFDLSNKAAIENFSPDMVLEDGLRTIWLNRYRYSMMHPTHALFLDQYINSPLIASVQDKEDTTHKQMMQDFYENLVRKKELDPMPVKVYWAIAFYPLFQMIRFQLQKGTHPYIDEVENEDMILDCFQRIVRALKPCQ